MSVQIAIVCTTCRCPGATDVGADREPIQSLRTKLKGRGWAVGCYSMEDRSSAGSRDFCPPCIQNYVRIERFLADAAEALGAVRPEDGAPRALNWTQVIDAIRELREDRDRGNLRAERAEQESGICYAPLLGDPRPCGLAHGHAGEHSP